MRVTSEVVREIIEKQDIIVEFQPIYSLNTKKYIGLEALARGIYNGEQIPPTILFQQAQKKTRFSLHGEWGIQR